MTHQQTIQKVYASLSDVFARLDSSFMLPDPVRSYHESNDSWSIDQILEHITLTDHYLMLVIRKSVITALKRSAHKPIPPENSPLDFIDQIGDPDAFPWIRPEHMEPSGRISSAAVRALLHDQVSECLHFLEVMPNGEGTLHKVRMSVQNLGKLDVYQWLYFLSRHAHRHTVEIDRLKRHYLALHE